MKNKSKIIRILISSIAALIFFSLIILKYFSCVNIYQPIKISVYGLDNNDLNKIAFYCNTSLGRKYILFREKNTWNTANYAFYKNLLFSSDYSINRKITRVELIIGNVNFTYNNKDFNKYWKKYSNKNHISQLKLLQTMGLF
jgi:hypothetical protein